MRAQVGFLERVPSSAMDSILTPQLYQGVAESQRSGETASHIDLNEPFIYTMHDVPGQMDNFPVGPGKHPRPRANRAHRI